MKRIRQRHRGYRLLLFTISAVVLIQPLARQWPFITPVMAILMALVMMLFLTRYSPLQANKRLLYGLGMAAITCELLWLLALVIDFSLAQHLAILHLLVWGTFISTFLLRKAKALMIEPYVTLAVVMGAASGYLLIGYLGAFLLLRKPLIFPWWRQISTPRAIPCGCSPPWWWLPFSCSPPPAVGWHALATCFPAPAA